MKWAFPRCRTAAERAYLLSHIVGIFANGFKVSLMLVRSRRDKTRQRRGADSMASGDEEHPYLIGDDGWPVDRPTAAEEARNEREAFAFSMQRAHSRWIGGNLFGSFAAVRLCWEHRQPPPEWLVDAVEVLIER